MAVVLNQEGLAVELPEKEATASLKAGTHQVPLNDPEGNPVVAPYADAPKLLSEGYSQPSHEQLQSLIKYAKHSTLPEQAKTFGEAALSGATFGLSRGLEHAVLGNAEEQRNREEVNPGVSTAGELAGLVGSSLTGVGEGAVLAKAGKAAESFAARALPKATSTIGKAVVDHIVPQAARGAIETAILQGGDEVAKAMVNDPEQSFQSAASNIGLSALLGGGVGGAFGAASPLWEITGKKALKTAADTAYKASSFMSGIPEEELRNAFEHRAVSQTGLDLKPAEYKSKLKGLVELGNESVEDLFNEHRSTAQKAMSEVPKEPALEAVQTVHNNISGAIKDMEAKPALFPARFPAKLQQIQGILNNAEGKETHEIFTALSEVKDSLDPLAKFGKLTPQADKEATDIIKNIRFQVKKHLENPEVFGEYGNKQSGINGIYSEYTNARKALNKAFARKEVNGTYTIDSGKVEKFLASRGNASNEARQEALDNFIKSFRKLEQAGYNSPAGDEYLNKILNFKEMTSSDKIARKFDLGPEDKAERLYQGNNEAEKQSSGILSQIGIPGGKHGLAGGFALFHHPLIAAALEVNNLARNPLDAFQKLAFLEKIAGKTTNLPGIKTLADTIKAAYKADNELNKAVKSVFSATPHLVSAGNDVKSTKKLDDRIKMAQEDPESLTKVVGDLGHYAPEHAAAAGGVVSRAVDYLSTLRPSTEKLGPLDSNRVPSTTEQAKYHRQLTIANKPISVFTYIGNGTLTSQDVTTVKTIYPDLYSSMAGKLFNEVVDTQHNGTTIPYRTRMTLSLFLGQPLDSSLMPKNIMTMQQLNTKPAQPSQPAQKGHKGSAKALKQTATLEATPEQAREQHNLKQ